VDWLNDPRYGTLTDDLWRLVMQLNMLAGEVDSDGMLPAVRDMAWELHIGLGTLQISLHHLCERGLVHQTPQGWVVTGFKESQAAPNSTERSRAFRKRRKSATQDEEDGNDAAVQDSARCTVQDSARCTVQDSARCATQDRTYDASETQLLRPYPVVGPVVDPVPAPDPAPAGSKRATKGRHRHKTTMQPVEKPVNPVDNFVDNCPVDGFPQEKGRKNSDPDDIPP